MNFGGLQRFSLIDYPGELAAVIFTVGCNFRCPYCHNPELVNGTAERIEESEVLNFLRKRSGKLTGVSITGGEPTLHGVELINFIKKVKSMGFKVKLDTNGSNPELLRELMEQNLLDYIAMDIKAPLSKYSYLTNSSLDEGLIRKSIELIMNSDTAYEFRTTVVKGLINQSDIEKILKTIKGARLYCIQNFSRSKTLDSDFINKEGLTGEELNNLKKLGNRYVKQCIVR